MIKKTLFILLLVSTIISARPLQGGVTYLSAPYEFTSRTQQDWHQLEADVRSAQTDLVIIEWSGFGGRIDYGEEFIKFVNHSDKKIVLRVVGQAASMHANVVCSVLRVEFKTGFLYFHMPADTDTNIVQLDRTAISESEGLMAGCVAKGIVTWNDIHRVDNDEVLIVYPNGSKHFIRDSRRGAR